MNSKFKRSSSTEGMIQCIRFVGIQCVSYKRVVCVTLFVVILTQLYLSWTEVSHLGRSEEGIVRIEANRVDELGASFKYQRCLSLSQPTFASEQQRWLPVDDRPMFVFSAYYDSRPLLAGHPLIRLIAHGLQAEYNKIGAVYCQLWYSGFPHAIITGPAEWKRNYRSIVFPKEYTSHFVLCPIADGIASAPMYVSIVTNACDQPNNTHLILNRQVDHPSGGMGVCISPLYNQYNDRLKVIELIELHRLMGVQRFTMYSLSISSQMEKALLQYVEEGILELVRWPLKDDPEKNLFYFDQRSAINDCIYRNMMRVRYAAVTDVDEFIVPRTFSTWQKTIGFLEANTNESVAAFVFQHYYFEKKNQTDANPHLETLSRLWRTEDVFPAGKVRSKTVHFLQKTVTVDIHFGLEYVPGWTDILVDPHIAALNHYRQEPMGNRKEEGNSHPLVQDRIIYRYSEALIRAVSKRTKDWR